MLKALQLTLFIFLIVFYFSSCCSSKTLFVEKQEDGTDISGIKQKCIISKQNKYLFADVKNKKNKTHNQYFINIFNCDTLSKKIFKGNTVQVLIFTTDPNVDVLVTDIDKNILSKMIPFVDSSNRCFENFINDIKGFKIYYDGKVKR